MTTIASTAESSAEQSPLSARADVQSDSLVRLSSSLKTYVHDQDKAITPSATVEKALRHLRRMADNGELQMVKRQNTVDGAHSFYVKNEYLTSSGKGLTEEQSKASAVMEFAERYSWLNFDYQRAPGYVVASHDVLSQGDIPTVPREYFLYNFIRPAEASERETATAEICSVPQKWILGTRLHDQSPYYFPLNYHNYLFTSNGLAAGNTLEEAIVQALCELVERENIYRMFVEGVPARRLNPETIEHPLLCAAINEAAAAGIELEIRDISYDFNIPTFIVRGTMPARKGRLLYQGHGQGTHVNPTKALIRAVSEYFEGVAIIKKTDDEVEPDWEFIQKNWQKMHMGFVCLQNPENFDLVAEEVTLDQMPDLSHDDMKIEIERIVERFQAGGHEAVIIDKTHPVLDIPLVRAFSPTARSVINTEIYTHQLVMSTLYHEAGNSKASMTNFWQYLLSLPTMQMLRKNPMLNMFLPGMLTRQPSSRFHKEDYLANIREHGKIKWNGLDMMKKTGMLKNMQSLIDKLK